MTTTKAVVTAPGVPPVISEYQRQANKVRVLQLVREVTGKVRVNALQGDGMTLDLCGMRWAGKGGVK